MQHLGHHAERFRGAERGQGQEQRHSTLRQVGFHSTINPLNITLKIVQSLCSMYHSVAGEAGECQFENVNNDGLIFVEYLESGPFFSNIRHFDALCI